MSEQTAPNATEEIDEQPQPPIHVCPECGQAWAAFACIAGECPAAADPKFPQDKLQRGTCPRCSNGWNDFMNRPSYHLGLPWSFTQ